MSFDPAKIFTDRFLMKYSYWMGYENCVYSACMMHITTNGECGNKFIQNNYSKNSEAKLRTNVMGFKIRVSEIQRSCCCSLWCNWCWLLIETFSLLLTCILYSSTCCCNWYNCWLSCWATCSDCEVACRAFFEGSKFIFCIFCKISLNQVARLSMS